MLPILYLRGLSTGDFKEALGVLLGDDASGLSPTAITRLTAAWQEAVASLRRDEAELLAFFDFPAEHWLHLRTANVIESPFATVRLRQRVTKGAGSRQKGLLMAFKLLLMAQERWRRINAAHLIPLVRAGIGFNDGTQAGRSAA